MSSFAQMLANRPRMNVSCIFEEVDGKFAREEGVWDRASIRIKGERRSISNLAEACALHLYCRLG